MRCLTLACVCHIAGADDACNFEKVSTRQSVRCHDIEYDLTVPEQCLDGSRKCGVIVDVHGGFMNASWEEALTEMSVNAANMDCITMQPTAVPGCTPGPTCMWPGSGPPCAEKVRLGLLDVEATFDTDSSRYYLGGSSQGGMCTNAMMLSEHADMIAAFTIAGAPVGLPSKRRNFMKFIGRHDPQFPLERNNADVQKVVKAWNLTEHSMLSTGEMHEHHLWTDAAKSVLVELLIHNYTVPTTGGHCAPGGHDDAAHESFIPGSQTKLSCPQPDPKKAERGCWQGEQTVAQYARVEAGRSPSLV